MTPIEDLRHCVRVGTEFDGGLVASAILSLAERQDVLLRLLQGLTGYMRNGWDDLPIWAVTPDDPPAKE